MKLKDNIEIPLDHDVGEEDGDSSDENTKMGAILDGGLGLGMKIVATGFVVSSVPLLLPPLVVVSALGLTFSVPFGLVYASYACTEKLMRKLLPPPHLVATATPLHENVEEESLPTFDLNNTGNAREVGVSEDDESMEKDPENEIQEKKQSVNETNSENDEQSETVLPDESKSSLDEAASIDMPEAKREETQYLRSAEPSEDEKIWRKIDSIRVVAGFKAPRNPSFFEELKALYAFTGIELPALVEDPSDLTELNDKLNFLMSVIGVK